MKVILIEPNKIINIGLTKFISETKNVILTESFFTTKQFLISYSDISNHNFDYLIINIAYTEHYTGLESLKALNKQLENKNIIVIYENKSQMRFRRTKKNNFQYMNITSEIDVLEKLLIL